MLKGRFDKVNVAVSLRESPAISGDVGTKG
jgi:hypothetical protein